ncbi:hypothetical protein HDIA_2845 [Hartmannibacter diazotrophicus]|uniref:Uncharacterized protein n=1 Tax=Hartmannibacter diazotrophicus TaxID=1482074 RepID=A0A2C9D7Y2_9HYPH|nr:hypothetical protein HDIA_2845 [Hartmannibacter diazotrophicus]
MPARMSAMREKSSGAKVLATFMEQHAGKLANSPDVHIAEIYEPK